MFSFSNFKLFLSCFLLVQLCHSQDRNINFELNKIELTNMPYFKSLIDIDSTNINQITYKQSYTYIKDIDFYNLSYKSYDSLNIEGFIIRPKEKGTYPVLIYNRGGNSSYGETKLNFIINFLGKISQKGYVIITSNLRGTNKENGNDEFGGKDVVDALDILQIIDQLPYVDKDRIGLLGWSRGVMTNFLMLKKTNRIKTNISIAGQASLELTHRDEMFEVYKKRIPNFEVDRENLLKQRSSLIAIDSLRNKSTTHFIIHGNSDSKVLVENAFLLYNKLLLNKQIVRLFIYENEEHGLKNVWENLILNINEWLKVHL